MGGAEGLRRAALRQAREKVVDLFFYVLIGSLSFVFVYPILFIVSEAMKQASDAADATVIWIPKSLSFDNFSFALDNMRFWSSFLNSALLSLGTALLQIVSCSFVAYGFARYRFAGDHIWLALVVFTFLVPPSTIIVPLYMMMNDLHWVNTYLPMLVPSAFGHGLKGALFVLIFIQFFRRLPAVLEEAARIDGAGAYKTYWVIMFPLARPAMLVVFLFSVVWHWNDVFEPSLFLSDPARYTLSQSLQALDALSSQEMADAMQTSLGGGSALGVLPTYANKIMAASLLVILPILVLYLIAQRYFVESVERTGIAGE